jgi:hypothetical protein
VSWVIKTHTDLYLAGYRMVAGRPEASRWEEVQGRAFRFDHRNHALNVALHVDEESTGLCARIVKLVPSPPIGDPKGAG